MRLPHRLDHRLKIKIVDAVSGEPRVKGGGRLPTSDANFIGFERSLDNVGNRSFLAAGETMRKIARAGAANRQLRLSHEQRPFSLIRPHMHCSASAIKMATDGKGDRSRAGDKNRSAIRACEICQGETVAVAE